MGSINRRPNGLWQARYRDAWGKQYSKCFPRKLDARRWLENAGYPYRTPRKQPPPDPEPWFPDPPETLRRPPPPGPPPPPSSLYRFFDADGQLLYIGVTSTYHKRWDGHVRVKQWWPRVCYANIEHFPDRAAALAAEEEAIKTEGPVFNVQHNCGEEKVRQVQGVS